MKICVLAGTRREYERWERDTGLTSRDAMCCIYDEQLHGQEFRRVIALPGFWSNRRARDIYELALTRVR